MTGDLSPRLRQNAARALLIVLFAYSLWQISGALYPTVERVRAGEAEVRRSLLFQRAAILVVPERAGARWPHDSTISAVLAAHCDRVVLRVPLLLPVPDRPRIEYNSWDIENLSVSIAAFAARGLRVTVSPLFVDAHGLAVEPSMSDRHQELFFTSLKEALHSLALSAEEGKADAFCLSSAMVRGHDTPDRLALVRGVRTVFAGMLTISSGSGSAVSDTIWNVVDYLTATESAASYPPSQPSDTAAWSAWRDLALRLHKPVVIEMPTARAGYGLWWDTAIDGILGWDASYRDTRSAPPLVALLRWLSDQPWVQGFAVDVTNADAGQIRALYDAIRIREFKREIDRTRTTVQ